MRYGCRRCDWRPDRDDATPHRDQLAEHAADTGHPLCIVCGGGLAVAELQTCAECVATTRARLAEIVERYALLPGEFGHATATPPDAPGAAHSDETRLPGGDVLAMLAGGSQGRSQIRGVPMPDGTRSTEHEADERPGDPASIAYELGRWEDEWRLTRREPAAPGPATVWGAAHYLNARLGWAANHHDTFDEFADEMRRLLRRMQDVTGASQRPQVGVPCFDCGADLVREYGEDHYRCPRCHRDYDDASYWLAVKANLEQRGAG